MSTWGGRDLTRLLEIHASRLVDAIFNVNPLYTEMKRLSTWLGKKQINKDKDMWYINR